MTAVIEDPDFDKKEAQREWIEHSIQVWNDGYFKHGTQFQTMPRDGRRMADLGFDAFESDLDDLGMNCITLAFPKLLEYTETFDESCGADFRVNVWLYVAMCAWILENRHDQESLTTAADMTHQASLQATYPIDKWCMDGNGPIFVAAGQYERCLEYFNRSKDFKIPRGAGQILTHRAMCYVLCKHRLEESWPNEKIERAWGSLFKSCVFPNSNFGLGCGITRQVWTKLRYWDLVADASRPTAIQAYKQYVAAERAYDAEELRKLMAEAAVNPRVAREVARLMRDAKKYTKQYLEMKTQE